MGTNVQPGMSPPLQVENTELWDLDGSDKRAESAAAAWVGNDMMANDTSFSFAEASTVPAEALHKCAWLAIHFPCM